MKKQLKINEVKPNESNPRIIKDDRFQKLIKSIKDFPEMLELRPIVVDENMIVLGGNMRLKASKEAGLKTVWVEIATGLSEEQKKEFIVKDNVGFGDWEWDMLANEWDSVQLSDWGLNVWTNQDDMFQNEIDDIEEITDFTEAVNFSVRCDNLEQLEVLKKKLNTTASKITYNEFVNKLKL
jgi:ParB-like chromosome segregation protein Spo0J